MHPAEVISLQCCPVYSLVACTIHPLCMWQDKKSLSIAMLVEGHPQAFVDFFQLLHSTLLHDQPTAAAPAAAAAGPKPAGGPAAGKQGSPAKAGVPGAMDLPQESLMLLKTQLVKADNARR